MDAKRALELELAHTKEKCLTLERGERDREIRVRESQTSPLQGCVRACVCVCVSVYVCLRVCVYVCLCVWGGGVCSGTQMLARVRLTWPELY